MDIDSNGTLSENEFLKGAKKFFGEQYTETEAIQLYKKIDLNGDGYIQFNEFALVALHKDELHSAEKLRAAFDMLDRNGDQTISADELMEVFSFNENFDNKMAQEMIRQVDINRDGGIQFEEFEIMMRSIDFEKVIKGPQERAQGNSKKG